MQKDNSTYNLKVFYNATDNCCILLDSVILVQFYLHF